MNNAVSLWKIRELRSGGVPGPRRVMTMTDPQVQVIVAIGLAFMFAGFGQAALARSPASAEHPQPPRRAAIHGR
jgi:hypothetical protein